MTVGIAVLAMLDVAAPAGARPGMPVTISRHQRIYVANRHCRGHTYRPQNITLACRYYDLFATEVHFFPGTSDVYGSPKADASATIHENACKPSCASGTFISDKGALILTRIVRCNDGLLYYSRAEYAFPEGQGKVDIEPRERCSLVRAGAGYEKVPGLDTAFIGLTKVWPLRRAEVVERDGKVYVRS